MTQDELDALPECGWIGYQQLLDGTRKPIIYQNFALYQPDGEPVIVRDQYGDWRLIGYAYDLKWKRRIIFR